MSFTDYTTVIGVDEGHVAHLEASFPTWMAHKPSLRQVPLLVFYDRQMPHEALNRLLDATAGHNRVKYQAWPNKDARFPGTPGQRWDDPQRHKMLAGFVHVPAQYVETGYWLKLDLDAVAMGVDPWIEEEWFKDGPVIVSHPWGYTKPPHQMLDLDRWVAQNERDLPLWANEYPLGLIPKVGSNAVSHSRIISWCGFFQTRFTQKCSEAARATCIPCTLPVCSQDGFMWYLAKRGGFGIKTANMKTRGWKHCSKLRYVQESARESLRNLA